MITCQRTTSSDSDFKTLIINLDKELWTRYPRIQQKFTQFNFIDENARVIIAYENAQPIGCGCFRPMEEPGSVEIKRMYVVPAFRNRGVGKLILRELEEWAQEDGFMQSLLESGNNQPEAIAAYEKSGYVHIPKFGPYVNIEESICMMKIL